MFIYCFCGIGEKESYCARVSVLVPYSLFPVLSQLRDSEMVHVRSTRQANLDALRGFPYRSMDFIAFHGLDNSVANPGFRIDVLFRRYREGGGRKEESTVKCTP